MMRISRGKLILSIWLLFALFGIVFSTENLAFLSIEKVSAAHDLTLSYKVSSTDVLATRVLSFATEVECTKAINFFTTLNAAITEAVLIPFHAAVAPFDLEFILPNGLGIEIKTVVAGAAHGKLSLALGGALTPIPTTPGEHTVDATDPSLFVKTTASPPVTLFTFASPRNGATKELFQDPKCIFLGTYSLGTPTAPTGPIPNGATGGFKVGARTFQYRYFGTIPLSTCIVYFGKENESGLVSKVVRFLAPMGVGLGSWYLLSAIFAHGFNFVDKEGYELGAIAALIPFRSFLLFPAVNVDEDEDPDIDAYGNDDNIATDESDNYDDETYTSSRKDRPSTGDDIDNADEENIDEFADEDVGSDAVPIAAVSLLACLLPWLI